MLVVPLAWLRKSQGLRGFVPRCAEGAPSTSTTASRRSCGRECTNPAHAPSSTRFSCGAARNAHSPIRPMEEDRALVARARMREDWNERARAAAFHYILSEREFRVPEDFFRTGEEDYETLVAPVLRKLGFDPSGRVAVDVGCGAGRITRALARRFGHVYGLDVSDEMLKVASTFSRDLANITWLRSDGTSLAPVETTSVDFVFSYLVLQHIPRRDLALGLVAEIIRVLRPGGAFLFQFISGRGGDMNWRGRTRLVGYGQTQVRSARRRPGRDRHEGRGAAWLGRAQGGTHLARCSARGTGSPWDGVGLRGGRCRCLGMGHETHLVLQM